MPGVPSATLEAWAVPVAAAPPGTPAPDHTYAISSCGLRWGCWGRANGGAQLSSRVGSSAIADCLSQPNSEAGIRYGITGVCHQTANRILLPAGITVQGCAGYRLSVAAFRVYGRGAWPELQACFSGATVPSAGLGRSRSGNVSGSSSVQSTSQSWMEPQVTELLALAEAALGKRLDENTRRSVRRIQRDFTRRQDQLVRVLDLGVMPPEEYLGQFNALLSGMMERIRLTLGNERFDVVFGEAGHHPEALIDRSTFVDAMAAERRRLAR